MDVRAEKIELIRLITEIESEKVLKKIKSVIASSRKTVAEQHESPIMNKRLEESRQQIKAGNGVKVSLDDIWK